MISENKVSNADFIDELERLLSISIELSAFIGTAYALYQDLYHGDGCFIEHSLITRVNVLNELFKEINDKISTLSTAFSGYHFVANGEYYEVLLSFDLPD